VANKFIRGALIEFMPAFGTSLPNVIVFQFNPETMTHAWTQPEAVEGGAAVAGVKPNPLAVQGQPGESFTFTLMLDAGEPIADGDLVAGPVARVSGIYSRLAALEMLQYPVPADPAAQLAGQASAVAQAAQAAGVPGTRAIPEQRPIPENQLPTVLFVWGPGRIVPVRVITLSITEKLYDQFLNPTQAEAAITLRVLTEADLEFVTGPLKGVANGAYRYSQHLREVLALVNLGNAGESILGMLPI
jgi:hypothetical protein